MSAFRRLDRAKTRPRPRPCVTFHTMLIDLLAPCLLSICGGRLLAPRGPRTVDSALCYLFMVLNCVLVGCMCHILTEHFCEMLNFFLHILMRLTTRKLQYACRANEAHCTTKLRAVAGVLGRDAIPCISEEREVF
jgi:hypothetical protein